MTRPLQSPKPRYRPSTAHPTAPARCPASSGSGKPPGTPATGTAWALFTNDGIYQDFSLDYRFTGRAEIAQFVETSGRNVTGLHVTVTDAFRTGDRVGVRFVFSGQINGAPRAFSVPVFTVMELKGNKITYDGDYYNRLEVLRQSGLPTG